jgi:hypothetical protein
MDQDVPLSVSIFTGSATVPNRFLIDVPGTTVEEKLKNEMYQRTGIRGESKQLLYLIGSMIGAFDSHLGAIFSLIIMSSCTRC